jgi:putative hemolysin
MMQTQTLWRPVDTAEMVPAGVLRGMYKWVQPVVEHWMGFGELAKIYEAAKTGGENGEASPVAFAENILKYLKVDLKLSEDLERALAEVEGPVVLASNHPYGCIDAMALMLCMERCRPGNWKIFANQLLRSIPELQSVIVDVDPFAQASARKKNMRAMRMAFEHLASDGVIGMFPARRVSSWSEDLGALLDLPWTEHAVKLCERTQATLIVLHMDGRNSDHFLSIPPSDLLRRSLALAKEVPRQCDRELKVSLGRVYQPAELALLRKNGVEKLIADCHSAVDRRSLRVNSQSVDVENTEYPAVHLPVGEMVQSLPEGCQLEASEEFGLSFFQGEQSAELMEQIGRAREITFQHIGAGSGNDVDLTPEDTYYHHLLLWEKSSGDLVGAYRIGLVQAVIRERGESGVYLDHVFDLQPAFYQKLGNAMELSRSFILPHFQKHPKVLDLLWRGLGQVAQRTECYTMFGSVTISASFSPLSQSVLVETLDKFHSDSSELRDHVRAKIPFEPVTKYHSLVAEAWAEDGINRLNAVIENYENDQKSIPPLIRYYIALGAKFSAFNVEPTFNNAIYCLLRVDLRKMPLRYRKRFLSE